MASSHVLVWGYFHIVFLMLPCSNFVGCGHSSAEVQTWGAATRLLQERDPQAEWWFLQSSEQWHQLSCNPGQGSLQAKCTVADAEPSSPRKQGTQNVIDYSSSPKHQADIWAATSTSRTCKIRREQEIQCSLSLPLMVRPGADSPGTHQV